MIELSPILEKIHQLAPPGIIHFYGQLPEDPWTKAHEDLERALVETDTAVQLTMLDIFEARIVDLIRVYHDVISVAKMERPPRVTPMEKGWHRGSVNYSRGCVCCDACFAPMSERRGMIMKKQIVEDELGEPETDITALCDRCYKPERKVR